MKLKLTLLLAAVFTVYSTSFATNYYWVGGGGSWFDFSNHWATTSGGSVFHSQAPTANDDVFFDANSFPATPSFPNVVDLSGTGICRSMSWDGATNNPFFIFGPGGTLQVYGSLSLSATVTSPSLNIDFKGAGTGKTVKTAGKRIINLGFDGTGDWILEDALDVFSVIIFNGSLNTNSQPVKAAVFSDIASGPAFLNLGNSVITIDNMMTVTSNPGLTVIPGQSEILLPNFGRFNGGGKTWYKLTGNNPAASVTLFEVGFNTTFLGPVSFAGDAELGGINTFSQLIFSPGHTYSLSRLFPQTIAPGGSWTATGTSSQPIRIQSTFQGTPASVVKTSGSVCLDYVRISDISASGGALFNAGKAPERSQDLGGNTGWLFTDGGIFYADADGDGYGNPAVVLQSCGAPAGYVTNNQDCNDNNAAINPAAVEICNNGIDDNCNGVIDENGSGGVSAGNDTTIFYGYPVNNCVIRKAIAGTGYTYTWTINRALKRGETVSGLNSQTVTACLKDTATLCVTAVNASGCSFTDCFTINVTDITCDNDRKDPRKDDRKEKGKGKGKGKDDDDDDDDDHHPGRSGKVIVCHNGRSICVSVQSVPAHLAHGDYLGACNRNNCNNATLFSGIEPEVKTAGWQVYPNPTKTGSVSVLILDNPSGFEKLEVSDVTGKLISTIRVVKNQTRFELKLPGTGIFFVKLTSSAGETFVKKVVVL